MNRTTAALAGAVALAALTLTAVPAQAATPTALATARAQIGKPYKYGATGPNSFDCSGLTQYSFKAAGKSLPRTAQQQFNATKRIAPADRKPGDLIFIGSPSNIYHAGVFAGVRSGKGYMVNANTGSYRGRKVVEAPVTEYTAGSPRAYYGRP